MALKYRADLGRARRPTVAAYGFRRGVVLAATATGGESRRQSNQPRRGCENRRSRSHSRCVHPVNECYKGFRQSCVNHPLERNGELTGHGLDLLRGRLEARRGRRIDAPPALKDAKRFAKHLAAEFPAVFLFLRGPSIDATKLAGRTGHPPRGGYPVNGREKLDGMSSWTYGSLLGGRQHIRKVCGGNRTRKGADPNKCSRPSCVPPVNAAWTCRR